MALDRRRALKVLRFGALAVAGVLILMMIAWVVSDPVENLQTDWTAFDNAGDRIVSDETVYRPWSEDAEPLPYLYPPFALWLALPLSALGFWLSYTYSALLCFGGYALGLGFFGKLTDSSENRLVATTLAIASGAAMGSTLIGQYSGLYVGFLGAAAFLFVRDKQLLAGVALSLLWLKPNIAIAVPVVLVWSRSWRALGGMTAGTAGLVIASLPFGTNQWGEFVEALRRMAELQQAGLVPVDKMVTALSSIQTIFGLEDATRTSTIIWVVIASVLGVSVLLPWTKERVSSDPLRAVAALALFVVAANPRMYFYDATVAVLGMFGVWASAQNGRREREGRWLSVLCLLVWVGSWGSIWLSMNILVGPVAGLALIVVAASCVSEGRLGGERSVADLGAGDASMAGTDSHPAITGALPDAA